MPPAAAHQLTSASPRLEGLHPSASNGPVPDGASPAYSQAHSQGQYPFSPAVGSGFLGSLPSGSNPFTGQPSNPFTGQPSNPFTGQPSNPPVGQPSSSFNRQPSNPFAGQPSHPYNAQQSSGAGSSSIAQDQLQAQFALASQFAASQASGGHQYPLPGPFGMPTPMQYPGMPNTGFPHSGAYPHMHPAYASFAAYSANAARLVSAGSYPIGMSMNLDHGMHMPNQYGQMGTPSGSAEGLPPPPPY